MKSPARFAGITVTVEWDTRAVNDVAEFKKFENDDVGYFEWVDAHSGYVLTKYTRGDGYSLHIPPCKHLGPYNTDKPRATRKPRWWAAERVTLQRLAEKMGQVGPVHECGLCMHRSTTRSRHY